MFDKAFKFWNDIFMAIDTTFYLSFQWQGDFRWLKDNIISSFSWSGLLVKSFKNCPVKNEISLYWEESVIQTKKKKKIISVSCKQSLKGSFFFCKHDILKG